MVDSLPTVKEAVYDLRSECADFESFVLDTLGQLETMRADLMERRNDLEAERQRLTQEEAELKQRLADAENGQTGDADIDDQIDRLQSKLDEANAALERERERAEQGGLQERELGDHINQLEQTRAELEAERDQARREREELDSVREELDEARNELDHLRGQSQHLDQGQFAEMEEERLALEAELEQARHRAAELANTIAEQKKQLAEERNGWSEELKQLRGLLESRAILQAAPPNPPHTEHSPESGVAAQAPSSAGMASADPVVGSVMAQFAQLQKDAASRRAKKRD